ncbi:MAG: response regulator [Nitrosopumilus sp.]|nr:response regulator [Nitrosopumilus sp.]
MKILLVDDNPDIIKFLTRVFSVKGHEIRSVNNGKDGLELIKNEEWGLILLDIAMPNFSGLDVIDELEKINMLKKNPIWVFTAASINDDEIDELIVRGVSGLIRKPVRIKELFTKIPQLQLT